MKKLLLNSILLLFCAASVQAVTFTNASSITLNDNGASSLYPSPISVTGLTGNISSVTVTINSLSHTWVHDVSIILQSPTGASLLLQSGAADNQSASNLTYTFSDLGATQLSSSSIWMNNGTYKPTGYFWDLWPAPAPMTPPGAGTYNTPGPFGAPTETLASTFNGAAPNGQWNLFVADFAVGDVGQVAGGWTLDIVTTNVPLHVDLTSFSIHSLENNNLLNWTVENEKNVKSYEIQCAENNIDFEKVTTVSPEGKDKLNFTYRYAHEINQVGKLYYRIKVLGMDGSANYSNIIAVNKEMNDASVSIYPTLVEDKVFISAVQDKIESIQIFTITGIPILTSNPETNYLALNLNSLNIVRGYYIVSVTDKLGAQYNQKIFKK